MAEAEKDSVSLISLTKKLKERDKFQSGVLNVSEFGLVQMTRKRSGKTLVQTLTNTCPMCTGYGFVKSVPTQTYAILRKLKTELSSKRYGHDVQLVVSPAVFEHITTLEYNAILELEKSFNCKITVVRKDTMAIDQYKIEKK
jgi:ribonuclease G